VIFLVPLSSVFLYWRFKDDLEEEVEAYDKGESDNIVDKENANKIPSMPAVTPSELIANTDANRAIAEVDGSGDSADVTNSNGVATNGDSSRTASKSNSNGDSNIGNSSDDQQLANKQDVSDLDNRDKNHENDKNYIKNLDLESMIAKNSITNLWMLLQVSVVGLGIVLALFLSPVHKQEAAWFMFLGMLVF
jgi:hypothetical protein